MCETAIAATAADAQRLEIRIAKSRVLLRLFLAAIFLFGGLWLILGRLYPALGYFVVPFGLISVYFGARLLLDTHPGLVLDHDAMTINPRVGVGDSVRWTEITSISLTPYAQSYQLVVHVSDPKPYLQRGNPIVRKLNSLSTTIFGSPVRLDANLLACDRDDLLRVSTDFLAKYGSANRR